MGYCLIPETIVNLYNAQTIPGLGEHITIFFARFHPFITRPKIFTVGFSHAVYPFLFERGFLQTKFFTKKY